MILPSKTQRGVMAATAAISAGSVLLQLYLQVTREHLDHTVVWRLVNYFSFFTILTNMLITAILVAALARPASRLAQPGAFAAGAVYIFVVAVTYQLLLRGDPHGLSLLADTGLHAIAPALFILIWLLWTPKSRLRWSEPAAWLIYPALYTAYILLRGALFHLYPYFFVDVDTLGYARALLNGVLFLAGFWLLGLGAVALGRMDIFRVRAKA
jgi:hypothetical protein